MSDNKANAEPSMEEILASIRQIINQPEGEASEADAAAALPEPELDPVDDAPEDDDVMELTQILEEPEPIAEPEPDPIPVAPVPVAAEPESAPFTPPPAQPAPMPYTPTPAATTPSELITGQTAAAAAAALSGLANSVYQERMEQSLPFGNNHRTLESLVVESIKPLLKEWLDEHLLAIVERVVQAEVEKLTKRIGS